MNQLSGSSNLNSGSTCSDVGGGSDSAIYTSTAGNFDGTSVFTPTDGSTPASTVSVGMYVALYNTGDVVCRAVAKVLTVAAGVNGAITIDTTVKYGTVPTSNSGSRALKCGGAWASLVLAVSPGVLSVNVAVPQSTRINIKAATYAGTSTSANMQFPGTATFQVMIRGYKTTPGDQDTNNVPVLGTDIPSFTFTTGNFTNSGTGHKFLNIGWSIATGSGTTYVVACIGAAVTFENCIITHGNANAGAAAINMAATAISLVGCYLSATTTAAEVVTASSSGAAIIGCTVKGGIIGVISTNAITMAYNVFDSQAGDVATFSSGPVTLINNSIYSPTGNGFNFTTVSANGSVLVNNYFSTVNQASKSAINNTSGTNTTLIICVANAYFNCTANITGVTETFSILDNGTLASEAFKSPASQDFTMLPVGWNLGFPGKFCNTSVFRGYLDVGAVQSIIASGGAYRPQQRPSGV